MSTTDAPTLVEQLGVKVGDIFSSSWGWEQTNVDFYQVVGLTAASVKVRRIEARSVAMTGNMSGQVVAAPGRFLEHAPVLTKRLKSYTDRSGEVRVYFKQSSYADAYLWSGEPLYNSWYG